MEFIGGQRGSRSLCYDGYMYSKKAAKATRIRLECSQQRAFERKGAVTTSLSASEH